MRVGLPGSCEWAQWGFWGEQGFGAPNQIRANKGAMNRARASIHVTSNGRGEEPQTIGALRVLGFLLRPLETQISTEPRVSQPAFCSIRACTVMHEWNINPWMIWFATRSGGIKSCVPECPGRKNPWRNSAAAMHAGRLQLRATHPTGISCANLIQGGTAPNWGACRVG